MAETNITDAEAEGYYVGLSSCPRLVARSNTNEPWSPVYDHWTVLKTLDPIGEHAIVSLWDQASSELRSAIINALKDINWTAIDILRLGYCRRPGTIDKPDEMFPKLLISVQPDSVDRLLGSKVTLDCRKILQGYGINDMEVEIMETHVSMFNSPKLTSQPITDDVQMDAQLSEFVGACIANKATPFREGTKGFYVRIKDTDRLLFVTCRHVLFNDSFPNVDHDHNGNAPNMVIQPGQETYEHFVSQLSDYTTMLQELGDEATPAQREELDRAKEMKEKYGKLHDKKSRIIGHVLYSPKYSLVTSKTGVDRLRDWALVELHQDKHETVFSEMRNMVVAGPRAGQRLWQVLYHELEDEDRRRVENQLPVHHTNTYDLTRSVQEFEMELPNEASRSLENERAMVVVKFGRTTGLTFGVANEVKSVRRMLWLGYEVISQEWCILGHKKKGQCRQPFSAEGDSGSCILYMYGRIGGMLTSGKPTGNHESDVSYATPIEWLLKDIKQKRVIQKVPGDFTRSIENWLGLAEYLLNLPDKKLPQVVSISWGTYEQHIPKAKNTTKFLPTWPSVCPYVTSVGGTESNSPERAWLDTEYDQSGGGGFSDLFSRPSYQDKVVKDYLKKNEKQWKQWKNYINKDGRAFPDVSALASGHQVMVNGQQFTAGGASAAAATVGAIIALLNNERFKKGTSAMGFLNPWLYRTGQAGFTDILEGKTSGCPGVSLEGFPSPEIPNAGWDAVKGWDFATGFGTPRFDKLKKLAT
ncbi:tripeptidyl-peptidase I [Fusarium coicis]|nr:tripeptidyl-peptidase I [Fusarium coicis]